MTTNSGVNKEGSPFAGIFMLNLLNYFFVSTVFLGGFLLFTSPFEFYDSYIFILLFLFIYTIRYHKIDFNRIFLVIVLVLTIFSLVNVYLGKDTVFLMMKQVSGILLTGTAYYLLIIINKYDIDKLFKIYLQIALIVAMIGIFQEFSYLLGFKSGYDYSGFIQKWSLCPATGGMPRVNSIFMEPSHFAITMAPAFFVSLSNFVGKKPMYLNTVSIWGNTIIIISYILTFSAIAYMAIAISLLLIFNVKKFKSFLSVSVIMLILIFAAYKYIPEIQMRVDSTVGLVTGSTKVDNSHLSVYALISNGFVAYKSFMDSPVFGRGLGSHPLSYDKFFLPNVSNGLWSRNYPLANRQDAGSLFFRLVSETGLFGVIVVLYFIFKFRLKMRDTHGLVMLSNGIFILFILQLLKQGHYFYDGLFFFVWMYYFAYQSYHKTNLNNPESES